MFHGAGLANIAQAFGIRCFADHGNHGFVIGQIRTDATSALKAEAQGVVRDVLVRAGDAVTRGQILVRLDPKPLDLEVQSAQAALRTAEFNVATELGADSSFEGRVRPERRAFVRASKGIDGLEIALERAKLNREHADII